MTKAVPGQTGEAPQPPEGRVTNSGAETTGRGEPDPTPEAEAGEDLVSREAHGVDPTGEQEAEEWRHGRTGKRDGATGQQRTPRKGEKRETGRKREKNEERATTVG